MNILLSWAGLSRPCLSMAVGIYLNSWINEKYDSCYSFSIGLLHMFSCFKPLCLTVQYLISSKSKVLPHSPLSWRNFVIFPGKVPVHQIETLSVVESCFSLFFWATAELWGTIFVFQWFSTLLIFLIITKLGIANVAWGRPEGRRRGSLLFHSIYSPVLTTSSISSGEENSPRIAKWKTHLIWIVWKNELRVRSQREIYVLWCAVKMQFLRRFFLVKNHSGQDKGPVFNMHGRLQTQLFVLFVRVFLKVDRLEFVWFPHLVSSLATRCTVLANSTIYMMQSLNNCLKFGTKASHWLVALPLPPPEPTLGKSDIATWSILVLNCLPCTSWINLRAPFYFFQVYQHGAKVFELTRISPTKSFINTQQESARGCLIHKLGFDFMSFMLIALLHFSRIARYWGNAKRIRAMIWAYDSAFSFLRTTDNEAVAASFNLFPDILFWLEDGTMFITYECKKWKMKISLTGVHYKTSQ